MSKSCIRCGKPLRLNEEGICDECSTDVMGKKKRRSYFLSFFFHILVLTFVYYYFFMR